MKQTGKKENVLDKRIQNSERDIQNLDDNHESFICNDKLGTIHDDIANGIKVRNHCDWFKHDKKSSIFFKNLERHIATKNQIWSILYNNKIIDTLAKVNDSLYNFLTLLTKKSKCLDICPTEGLSKINIPGLNFDEVQRCERTITKDESFRL